MEPINTRNVSAGIRPTPIKSSSAEPTVKATNNKSMRPEFVSPKGVIDAESGVYVVQFRNSSTGNVNFQYPNKKVVAEYTRSDKLVSAPETKSHETSSSASAGTTPVETTASTTVASSGQTNTNSGSVSVATLSTSDNV
jgi:hypothetical protein